MSARILELQLLVACTLALPVTIPAQESRPQTHQGKEPIYQGKPLSYWIQRLQSRLKAGPAAALVRGTCAYTLGQFGRAAKVAEAALSKATEDPDPSVRQMAEQSLRLLNWDPSSPRRRMLPGRRAK